MSTSQAESTFEIRNPAIGEPVASVPALSADDVEVMAQRARVAQERWAALGLGERGRVLRRMHRWMADNRDRVIETLVSEAGKTYEDALVIEVGYVTQIEKYCKQQAIVVARWRPRRDPWMFPYSKRRTGVVAWAIRVSGRIESKKGDEHGCGF